MDGKISKKVTQNLPRKHQMKSTKIDSKSIKNRPKIVLGSSWDMLEVNNKKIWDFTAFQLRILGRLGGFLGRLGPNKVANMVPTWFPKRTPNQSQIEAKINQFLNASWDRIFEGFWWILEGKMEASWQMTFLPLQH